MLRFAHPIDIHVQPDLRGGEGMAAAFRHQYMTFGWKAEARKKKG